MQADGGDGDPDEFKEFTDQELQSKIARLRALHVLRTADGGEKVRRMVYRVEKELDRRRAARPRKGEEDAEEFKNSTDQDARLKTKRRLPALSGSTPNGDDGKKLRKCVCKVEKEHDHGHAVGVETGQIQVVQSLSVDDLYTFVPQVENTSNHAPLVDSEATNGGLSPFASTNLEGEGAIGANIGAEEVEPTTSICSRHKGEETRGKHKHSKIGRVLEKCVGALDEVKEAPKQEDRFTIEKCVGALEAIEELTDMEKAKVLKLFKCGLNREIFMTTKSASVRLIWLKSEIYA